jgi:hypothetical protein
MFIRDGQIFNESGAAFPAMQAEQLAAHQLLPSAIITIIISLPFHFKE